MIFSFGGYYSADIILAQIIAITKRCVYLHNRLSVSEVGAIICVDFSISLLDRFCSAVHKSVVFFDAWLVTLWGFLVGVLINLRDEAR